MFAATGHAPASVSVVIPTRNEARNIPWVLERLPDFVDEVIIVDGRSSDGTVDVALRCRPDAVIVHQTRKGKGNALAAAFEVVRCDLVVMIDADGSMDPAEIVDFLQPLVEGTAYAKGSRFTGRGGSADITWFRRVGNAGLNMITNVLFRSRFTDLCYGYNAFTRECIAVFDLPDAHSPADPQWGDGFEIESLINLRVAYSGVAVREVASFEYERRYGESNLNTIRDGFRVLGTILSERWTAWRSPGRSLPPVPHPRAEAAVIDLRAKEPFDVDGAAPQGIPAADLPRRA